MSAARSSWGEKIAVLERIRALLNDPDRVVHDPRNYFEVGHREVNYVTAALHPHTCRVCFCGAVTLTVLERDTEYRELLTEKAKELGLLLDPACFAEFGDGPEGWLTSALVQGRAVEVVDACLADLGVETRTLVTA